MDAPPRRLVAARHPGNCQRCEQFAYHRVFRDEQLICHACATRVRPARPRITVDCPEYRRSASLSAVVGLLRDLGHEELRSVSESDLGTRTARLRRAAEVRRVIAELEVVAGDLEGEG